MICLLVNWMRGALLQEVLHDGSESEALLPVCLNLLLELLGLRVLDVLAEYLQLLISLDNFIFKLSDLLLE